MGWRYRGFFNRYQKSKSIFKYLYEDIRCFFSFIYLLIINEGKHLPLIVYPHYPSKRSSIYRIAKYLNLFITNKLPPPPSDVPIIYWEYLTYRTEYDRLEPYAERVLPINYLSRDISKEYLDKCFYQAFGYSLGIEPTQFQGRCVEKNNINAKHDGRIIQCPIDIQQIKEGFVYQRLINNVKDGKFVEDIRTVIMKNRIVLVYIKQRPIETRFTNETSTAKLADPYKVFSSTEIRKIQRFCHMMYLEFGELDVLRDNDTGQIYVVDVNNTPQSPPQHISFQDHKMSIKILADAFQELFLDQHSSRKYRK